MRGRCTTDTTNIRAAVLKSARKREGRRRLSCRTAHELAKELHVPLRGIGRICDEEEIKIMLCQLGCF